MTKPEYLLLGTYTAVQQHKCDAKVIKVGDVEIPPSIQVKNLGVIFGSGMTMCPRTAT